MPTTWPTDLNPYRCDLLFLNNTTVFESPLTRTRQTLRRLGARWVLDGSWHVARDKAQRIDALLDAVQGAYGSFYLYDFTHPLPYNGDPGGSPRVTTAYASGTTSISVTGLPASQTWIKAGDLFELQQYVYRVTADITANGSGVGTATLNRGLVETLTGSPTSYPITFTRPRIEMRLRDDDQPRRGKSYNSLYEYSLSFIEVLPKS